MEKETIRIVTPQFERTWDLDFNFIPKTNEEFIEVVTQAPIDILKGMGFCFWDTMNSIAAENAIKPKSKIIHIPAINLDGSDAPDFDFDIGRGNSPIQLQDVDEDIYLIPGEWYNSIPDNYPLTSITGRIEPFKKGKTDNDIRFGCLAYGIRRKSINQVS